MRCAVWSGIDLGPRTWGGVVFTWSLRFERRAIFAAALDWVDDLG